MEHIVSDQRLKRDYAAIKQRVTFFNFYTKWQLKFYSVFSFLFFLMFYHVPKGVYYNIVLQWIVFFWVGVRRSNFMRSKFNIFRRSNFSIMRAKFSFFMRSKLTIILIRRSNFLSWDQNPKKHYYKFQSHDCSCD